MKAYDFNGMIIWKQIPYNPYPESIAVGIFIIALGLAWYFLLRGNK